MSQHDSLRERKEQHKPKNTVSKKEDKIAARAAERVMAYLRERFTESFDKEIKPGIRYELSYEPSIKIGDMIRFRTRNGAENYDDFDHSYDDKEIRPDGGVIYLVKVRTVKDAHTVDGAERKEIIEKLPLAISEAKHQGTNVERILEGKKMQATGNAIERLGKNLSGIRSMMSNERIIPFICFGDGCDFSEEDEIDGIVDKLDGVAGINKAEVREKLANGARIVRAKIYTMNDFGPLNQLRVFKNPGQTISPVSMMFRYKPWTEDEVYNYTKEIAETSFRYYTM